MTRLTTSQAAGRGQGLPDRARAEEQATKHDAMSMYDEIHDEGEKESEGSKGLPGRNSLSPLFAFFVWAVLHSADQLLARKLT